MSDQRPNREVPGSYLIDIRRDGNKQMRVTDHGDHFRIYIGGKSKGMAIWVDAEELRRALAR